ncbi:MAG TPA: phosphatidylglycerophosphatase A [Patescibacteria group bacterium]|nr:phosphatidylglycerophosphatase A [Patescibacteria group bacterium]
MASAVETTASTETAAPPAAAGTDYSIGGVPPAVIGLLLIMLLPVIIWREKIWNWIKSLRPRLKPIPGGMKLTEWHCWLSSWFGSGFIRPAPGTMGSLAAIPVGYAIAYFSGPVGLGLAALALLCIGTVAADRFGKKSGAVDDQSIVVDEVVGLWIAAIPAETHMDLWWVAFVLFRLFDIYKPWPASFYDKRSVGGIDVMMDDVVAGIYAFPGVCGIAMFYLPN